MYLDLHLKTTLKKHTENSLSNTIQIKHKGDKTSEEKFKEASEAYHILSDEKRKANYDQFGHAAFEGAGGGGQGFGGFDTSSFSDIFEDFFSDFGGGGSSRRSSNRGNDLKI